MTAIPTITGNPGTALTGEHNKDLLEQLNVLVTRVNSLTGEGGSGDERLDAIEAILTVDAVSHFLTHNEKQWVAANVGGSTVSSAEKTWLDSNYTNETVTTAEKARIPSVAEKGVLTALATGGNSFFTQLGAPIAADTDRIVAEVAWADGTLTLAAQPDVPRNITAQLTDADNSISGLLTITGTDIAGRVITETMAPDALGGGKTLTGTKCFKTITSCVISGTSGAGVEDLIIIGVGNKIGVPVDLANAAEVVSVRLGGSLVASPVKATGASTSSIDASADTYNGSKVLDVVVQMGLT